MNPAILPDPLFDYQRLFNLLLPGTSLFVVAGLLSSFQHGGSLPDQLRGLVRVTAVLVLLALFDPVVQTTKMCVRSVVENGLNAKPEEISGKFMEKLMASEETENDDGLWSKVTRAGTHLYHALLAAVITLIALVALVISFLAYLAQELALELGIALSPILLGFLLLPATRSIGVQFLLYMFAIALVPLGWGAASLVSDQLIEFATNHRLGSATTATEALSFSMRNLFGALLLAVWMILSTLYAPFAILRAVTSGVHLGADAARSVQHYIRR